jgi:5'-nucleotidase
MIASCEKANYLLNDIQGNNIKISDSLITNNQLEYLIAPYRNELKRLEKVIGYSSQSLSVRDGKLESTLGNFIADILIEECNPVFKNLLGKNIDFCLLNYGGIRGTMNKGNITQYDLFTIMPFKNLATVVRLDGNKILELLKYLNKENIAHPISGINIEFENEKITTIIGGEEFDVNKSYYVLTSNYLQEGGDKMNFFKDPIELHELNLNIRDILINNIKKRKSLSSKLDNRIIRN